jgi:hypothetical protein
MYSALVAIAMGLALGGDTGQEVGSGPQPAIRPVSWELEFKFLDPERIEVQIPGESRPATYWYIVYTVVNRGPRSQRFFPMFQIVTDDLRVFDTDIGISPLVFEAIRDRHHVTHKYLVPPTKVIGALLSGDDNARESVAIWRDIDLNVNTFKVYVAGLSGESQVVSNPARDPNQPERPPVIGPSGRHGDRTQNAAEFTLRKTLEINYTLPGSPRARADVKPERGETRWIMR